MGDSASDQGQDTNEFTTDAELNQIASDAAQIANDRDSGREDTTDSLTARDLQQIENRASGRSANTQSFTEQSQNYVDDFSGANRGSLPTSRSPFTASLPSTFGKDYTRDYSDFTTADQLNTMSNSINNPVSNFLTRLGLPTTQNRINQGYTPSYKDGQITGTMDYGIGMGMPSNDKDMTGRGLAVSNYSPFDATQPQVDFGDINDVGNDGSESPQIIRRNPSDPMQGDPTDPTDPILSDDLAVNYLQDPYYLYSGQGNLYQPYGYAQNTLVDLLRTRNLTQPQQRAANLGLFGNPGDFS